MYSSQNIFIKHFNQTRCALIRNEPLLVIVQYALVAVVKSQIMQLIFDFYCWPSQMELTVDAQLQLLYDGSLTLCHIYHTGEAALPRHPGCISTQM